MKIVICNYITFICIFIITCTGCTQTDEGYHIEDLETYVNSVKSAEDKHRIPPLPVFQKRVKYKVDRSIITSPFLDYSSTSTYVENKQNIPITTHVETFSFSDYRLMNIRRSNNKYYVLLRTPDGVVYRKEKGMIIGKENAIIDKIDSNRVLIKQGDEVFVLN